METALDAALEAGFRLIDTATLYFNEHLIGRVVQRWLRHGKLRREDLFITTKVRRTASSCSATLMFHSLQLPMHAMRASDVAVFLRQSLDNLQLDYVDLYLIHMPFGFDKDGFDAATGYRLDALDTTTDHVAIWKVKYDILQ